MTTLDQARTWALELPEATEQDHHGMPSFRVRGKIFATVPDEDHIRIMVDESEIHAAVESDPEVCAEVYWGKKLSCVVVALQPASEALVRELLVEAWLTKAPKTLGRAFAEDASRPARVGDVHELAAAMPGVTVEHGPRGNPIYQVSRKSFVFFRTPRPDAVDPGTGEKYTDVILFWVPGEDDKEALVRDPRSPFFTTQHFDGHVSVLLRASRLAELSRRELAEVVEDAWLSRAPKRKREAWLAENPDR